MGILLHPSIILHLGMVFLLSLVKSSAYPEDVYMTEGTDSIYEVKKNGKLYGFSQVADMRITDKINTMKKLEKYLVDHQKTLSIQLESTIVSDSFDSLDGMFEAADVVAMIKVDNVFSDLENANIVDFEVVELHKGQETPAGAVISFDHPIYNEVKEFLDRK